MVLVEISKPVLEAQIQGFFQGFLGNKACFAMAKNHREHQ
jgi:hypothetical protein